MKKESPVSLEELETIFLSGDQQKQHRAISVEQQQEFREHHAAIRQAIEDRFQRNVIKVILAVVVGFLLIAILFPDRYEMMDKLVNTLVLVTSSFALGKMAGSNKVS
jgi:hypothetical protein